MGWLEKYKKDLADIVAKGDVTKPKSSFSIAHLVASAPRESNLTGLSSSDWNALNPFQKVLYADNTAKILDVLSRGNYATASGMTEWMNQENAAKASGHFLMPWEVDKGKVYGAAIDGLEGQSKKTFADFNAAYESGLSPDARARLNSGADSSIAKGLANFAEDVVLDPLSYVGPGVVKSIVKGVAPKIGIKAPNAVKNVVKEANPVAVAQKELADTGKTVLKPSAASEIKAPTIAIIPSKSVVANTIEQVPTLPKGKPAWLENIVANGTERSPAAVRAALLGQRSTLEQALQGVTGLRYQGLDKAKIPHLYKETTITRPAVKSIETADKTITGLESSLETVAGNPTRAVGKDLAIWKRSLKDVLDPPDIAYLTASRSKASFDKRLGEVLAKSGKVDFKSLEDLSVAVKAGQVLPDELSKILAAHGGAKTLKGAQKFLTDLNARIDRLNIPTAQELIDKAAVGDSKALEFKPVSLTTADKEIVSRVVSNVVTKEFKNPQKWKFQTAKGTLRTSATPGEGLGRNLQGFNRFSQYTLHRELMQEVASSVKAAGKLTREERMALVYDKYMPLLKAAEDTLISRGITPIVGKGSRGLPLSMHDVLSALPRNIVEHRMMDRLRHVPPTAILDAAGVVAYTIAKGKPLDESIKAIVEKAILQDIPGNTFRQSVLKGTATGGKYAIMSNSDLSRLADKFMAAGPEFAAAVERNSARAGIKYGQYVEALRKETIDKVIKDVATNIGNSSSILKIVDELDSYIANGAKALDEPVLDGATQQVKAELLATVNKIVPVAEIKSGLKAEQQFIEKGVNPGIARLEDAAKTVDELAMPASYIADFNDKLILTQTVAFLRNIFPHIGNKDLRPILLSHESAAKSVATKYAEQLGRIDKTYTKNEILEAWKNIQDQVGVKVTERVGQAQIELQQAMSTLFNLNPNRGIITMSGLSLDRINAKMRHFGIPDQFRLIGSTYKEGLASYRTWENVKDPLDLLSRMNSSVRAAQADKLIADTIIRQFGSKVATAERNVKIVNADRSLIGGLLEGHFFNKDIANQVRVLDTSIRELMKPPSSNKLLRLYDSAIHSYKAGLTIYVPAHHMRNLYGDMWLSSMDGLYNPKFYKDSIAVLASRKTNYKDFNPDVFNIGELGKNKPIVTLSYKGKDVPLDADNLYRLAVAKGVLTDYTIIEDLAVGASDNVLSTSVSKQMEKLSPFKGQIHNKVTKVSEYREHYARMAHFLYALTEQKTLKGATLKDAIENAGQAASNRVRKWHPDGSDYSAFERNQLRRFILFYSWIRKAIPLVLESAATQPGRFMLYPKAMYNMAEANGINLNGYADPFPTDQLFPTWMHDQALGPQIGQPGSYFGIKQGIPGPDTLEQYFSSPLTAWRTVFSGATPVIKVPYEIATQHSARTGAPISDWGSWALDQLPYGNRINTAVGDPVGTPAKSNVGYEPQLDLPGGATLDSKGITALNWLTGLGITDMSKPSYQKSAKSEQSNKVTK